MYFGMHESEARDMISAIFADGGLSGGGCLTLFGGLYIIHIEITDTKMMATSENAALPHGSGTNKVLGQSDFALFDCTASLHGYWSDVTRVRNSLTWTLVPFIYHPLQTFALKTSNISPDNLVKWSLVHAAQESAISVAREGIAARIVDEHARFVLRIAKLDQYFTHRLGHGKAGFYYLTNF